MKFINVVGYGFKNFFNFSGVVDRSVFWLWFLFTSLVEIALFKIGEAVNLPLLWLSLVFFIPSLALTVRRLRDAGKSPKVLWVWAMAPIGGVFGFFYGMSILSSDGSNDFGLLFEWLIDPLFAAIWAMKGTFGGVVIAFVIVSIFLLQPTKKL